MRRRGDTGSNSKQRRKESSSRPALFSPRVASFATDNNEGEKSGCRHLPARYNTGCTFSMNKNPCGARCSLLLSVAVVSLPHENLQRHTNSALLLLLPPPSLPASPLLQLHIPYNKNHHKCLPHC